MMITIQCLPVSIECQDVKTLIKKECGLSEFILDNLMSESDGTQKVRIVVADENEGLLIMDRLNGFRLEGQILKVKPVWKPQQQIRRMSPSTKGYSPVKRRMSATGRRLGRRMSPSDRRTTPRGRHYTKISDRSESPRRSSQGLQISPSRRLSTPDSRYSPSRWSPDVVVRSAQESETKAPNQATRTDCNRPGVSFSEERSSLNSENTHRETFIEGSGHFNFDNKELFDNVYKLAVKFVNKTQEIRKRERRPTSMNQEHICATQSPEPRNSRIENELKETMLQLFQGIKRLAPDTSDIPTKGCRRSPKHNSKLDNQNTNTPLNYKANSSGQTSGRNLNMRPPVVKNTSHNVQLPATSNVPTSNVPDNIPPVVAPNVPPVIMVNPTSVPPPYFMVDPCNVPTPFLMVNPPFGTSEYAPKFEPIPQHQVYQPTTSVFEDCTNQPPPPVEDDDTFHLYLCKENVDAFFSSEINALNEFLVSQIFLTTASSNHAPNFTFKGLQTPFRYELVTNDTDSKDWLINLDFKDFTLFNVIVYLHEELCYERAAIWLSGHSDYGDVEPLTKLKLQNQHLEELQISKWKFIKKIVTMEGTRLYVDLPPTSACSLKQIKTLSYELQQANFYLRALAVDKDAFDAGFNEASITDPSKLKSAIQNSQMPTLKKNPLTVMITLESKSLSLVELRNIRDKIIYLLFEYLKAGGKTKTDFINYGFISPCYFGVVPGNLQSKKWLLELDMGKLNKQSVLIIDCNDKRDKFFQMTAVIPILHDCSKHNSSEIYKKRLCIEYVIENFKQSNKGVKGIDFDMWKGLRIIKEKNRLILDLEIDVDSMNTLAGINFVLDYVQIESSPEIHNVNFEQKNRLAKDDSHAVVDVENISSDDDNDIICLGEVSDISESEMFDDNMISLGEVSDISDGSL